MKRGEIWTVADGGGYTGRPRPVVIVQDEAFAAIDSVTICPLTSDPTDLPLFRSPLLPQDDNGLRQESRIMADKITTVRKTKLGSRIGIVSPDDMRRLNQALVVFLGIAR